MSNTFEHLGLPEQMMAALKRMNFTTPTPIQSRTIPVAMQGRDILGSAQTGTGKTGAFCIPMIARLMVDEKAMGLIVTPTRELATQIVSVVHALTSNNRAMRTALLIGGDSMGKQFAQLRDRPRLIIGTPGRINDHLRRDGDLLGRVAFVAIDEADRMLDMGFSVQLDEILKSVPKDRQTLMFSATFPDAIVKFSRNYLNNPERISVNPEMKAAPKIKHEVKRTDSERKYTDLLAELEAREGSVIIFVKTQHGTDRLAKKLEGDNHTATPIHGGLRQNQRDRAVRDFRAQRTRILVATDVASRGLDIPHIEHVINYDMPQVAEDYIHRIGRTARAGAEGHAVAFVMPSDMQMWNSINRIMNPDAKPERVEGPQGNRGGFKRNNAKAGGAKKSYGPRGGDFRKREAGFGGERKERGGFERRDGRKPDDRKFPAREGRSFGGQDRPKGNRAEGGKAFVKYYNKDGNTASGERKPNDANWNSKSDRARYNAAEGRFEQPPKQSRGEGRGDGRQGNNRHDHDRPQSRDGAKPFHKRDERGGGFKQGGFKSEGRPSGNRDRNHRHDGKPAFRKDDREGKRADGHFKNADAPRKPRSDKPAAKKPFQFKEHSRKGVRTGGAPKGRAAV